jgi:imidazolonepropionase-like amidohydrolase
MIDARPKPGEILLSRISFSVPFAALGVAGALFTVGNACAQAPRPFSPLAFTGVSVLPMDREEVLANQTVIIENGRITYVGGPRPAPAGAILIDGRGKFLMPGIAEFHAHVPSGGQAMHAHRTLALYALAGVTTARGMLGAPMHLALRDSIAAGQVFGPRLLTSGPSFNGNSVTSPEQAMAMVRAQKEAGYDLLKIHPGVPRVAFDSLAATANRLGIPFAGHVPLEVGLDVAITAKHSTIDHLDGFIEAMYSGTSPLTPQLNGFFGLGIVRQLDMSRFQGIIDRVRASGVVMVPTQILTDNYANDATGDELTSLPEMRYWVPQQVASWRTSKNNLMARASVSREQRMEYIALRRRFIKALHDAGVPFLLGSDAPQLWNVPGFSAHRELVALVAAGLTPYQALRTGTVNVAKFLNEEGRSGVVRTGVRADLILLDANPLQDISNSSRIRGVVVNGRWIDSAERERMLARLAAQ